MNLDAAEWRTDAFGVLMKFSDYGDPASDHGWVIDHFPKSRSAGGTDEVANLRPLSIKPKPPSSITNDFLIIMGTRVPGD